MPCDKCNSKLVLDNHREVRCPKCDNIPLIDKKEALYITKKQLDYFNGVFDSILKDFNKNQLIAHLLDRREKLATNFFEDMPLLNLELFLTINALIRKVMSNCPVSDKEALDREELDKLISIYKHIIRIEEVLMQLEEDFAFLVPTIEKYDLSKVPIMRWSGLFYLFYSEDFLHIHDSFEIHDIVDERGAKSKLREYSLEYERIKKEEVEPITKTTEETIRDLYPTMLQFFCGLQKNVVYQRTFDFDYLLNKKITPRVVLKIYRNLPYSPGIINSTETRKFRLFLRRFVPTYQKEIMRYLVFSEKNQGVFPFFVEMDGRVFVTMNFSKLMAVFLYPFVHRDLFHSETQRRSCVFERTEVTREFTAKKFSCSHFERKNVLEIDVLAWKYHLLFVVECKFWDLTAFFGNRRVHDQRKRDIEGVIDGIKYTTKNEELTETKKVSLIEKIGYVKENLAEVCSECKFDQNKIKEIDSLVVTRSYPPIREYNGIRVISLDEIKRL